MTKNLLPEASMTDSSYEAIPDFGVLYDAVPIYVHRADVPFYLEQAARAGGKRGSAGVLELGCGTGRVLLPLARAGHAVTGVDSSQAMLAQCRAKLAAEAPAVRERVALVLADVRDFTVTPPEGGFALAIAPFRVFQHLTTPTDQLRCLAAVRRHLAPGGRLAFDVFNPNYRLLAQDRSEEVEEIAELRLLDGRYLRRTVRVTRVRWVEQVSDIELIYYVRSGNVTQRFVHAFPMRWYTPAELEHLLVRGGFRVEHAYGGLDCSTLTDESPEIIMVASRP